MKVVIDTNVLVSGILSADGPPGKIVNLIIGNELQVCYDGKILAEYDAILKRPRLALSGPLVTDLLTQIAAVGESVLALPMSQKLPDPTDEMFLEVTLAAEAECLITGNLKHFPPSCRQGIRVLSPKEFLEFYAARRAGGSGKVKSPSAGYGVKKRVHARMRRSRG